MRYVDSKGRRRVLTREQSHYLRESDGRHLTYGWGGYKSTRSVRLLEERGLITVMVRGSDQRWTITGHTELGREVLARWKKLEALRLFARPAERAEPKVPLGAPIRLGAPRVACRVSMERFVVLPAAMMTATLEALERVGCQFDHCPGPDVPAQDMMTCYVCDVLRQLRSEVQHQVRAET